MAQTNASLLMVDYTKDGTRRTVLDPLPVRSYFFLEQPGMFRGDWDIPAGDMPDR
jgi:hypothetical protein